VPPAGSGVLVVAASRPAGLIPIQAAR